MDVWSPLGLQSLILESICSNNSILAGLVASLFRFGGGVRRSLFSVHALFIVRVLFTIHGYSLFTLPRLCFVHTEGNAFQITTLIPRPFFVHALILRPRRNSEFKITYLILRPRLYSVHAKILKVNAY